MESLIWGAAAQLAGDHFCFMVQNTPYCKPIELKKYQIISYFARIPWQYFHLVLLHAWLGIQYICSNSCFPCLFFDLQLLPSGLGVLFIVWCKVPFHHTSMRTKPAWKNLKIFTLLHAFLVCFLTCCFCPQGWGGCLYHGAKHPFMRATRGWKIWKSLHYCMRVTRGSKIFKIIVIFTDSMSILWLGAAVPWAGGPFYFMVRSTPSWEQCELQKFSNS